MAIYLGGRKRISKRRSKRKHKRKRKIKSKKKYRKKRTKTKNLRGGGSITREYLINVLKENVAGGKMLKKKLNKNSNALLTYLEDTMSDENFNKVLENNKNMTFTQIGEMETRIGEMAENKNGGGGGDSFKEIVGEEDIWDNGSNWLRGHLIIGMLFMLWFGWMRENDVDDDYDDDY